jgi:hypothetical protein
MFELISGYSCFRESGTDNGGRGIIFASYKSNCQEVMLPHQHICKYTRTPPARKVHGQVYHIVIDRR